MTEPLDTSFAAWIAKRTSTPAACPDTDLLFAFATGSLDDPERQSACVQHLAACVSCRQAVQLALASGPFASELARELTPPASADVLPLRRRNSTRQRILGWSMAAAAALLLAVIWQPWRGTPDFNTIRAPTQAAVLPPDQAVLTVPPTHLRWPCVGTTSDYQIELLDAEAVPFWADTVSACEVALDASLFRDRRGGFYWRITPGLDGAPSSNFTFQLEP